ncbi:uncharacterized protein LOC141911639 [Tubulanus polymorphus]|uniref:uncharacterized protein LOC141911639 n=1 Tax=Tubulanus polymorphus TaxID=672921 RepID=UPI003DA4C6E5
MVKVKAAILSNARQSESPTKISGHLKCSNLRQLAGIVETAERADDVISVMQPFRSILPQDVDTSGAAKCDKKPHEIDVVCDGGRTWIRVVAQKAQIIHSTWSGECSYGKRNIVSQSEALVTCARHNPVNYTTPTVMFKFLQGVTESVAAALRARGVLIDMVSAIVADHCSSPRVDLDRRLEYNLDADDPPDVAQYLRSLGFRSPDGATTAIEVVDDCELVAPNDGRSFGGSNAGFNRFDSSDFGEMNSLPNPDAGSDIGPDKRGRTYESTGAGADLAQTAYGSPTAAATVVVDNIESSSDNRRLVTRIENKPSLTAGQTVIADRNYHHDVNDSLLIQSEEEQLAINDSDNSTPVADFVDSNPLLLLSRSPLSGYSVQPVEGVDAVGGDDYEIANEKSMLSSSVDFTSFSDRPLEGEIATGKSNICFGVRPLGDVGDWAADDRVENGNSRSVPNGVNSIRGGRLEDETARDDSNTRRSFDVILSRPGIASSSGAAATHHLKSRRQVSSDLGDGNRLPSPKPSTDDRRQPRCLSSEAINISATGSSVAVAAVAANTNDSILVDDVVKTTDKERAHQTSCNSFRILSDDVNTRLVDRRRRCEDAVQAIVAPPPPPPEISKVNLDITALIGLVSALTHGHCRYVFREPILTEQARWERQTPLLPDLHRFLEGKELFACDTAVADFKTILSTVGGPGEQRRGAELLNRIRIVPDSPSARTERLRASRQLSERGKVIFGTGDRIQAITVTSNSRLVRAAAGQGVNFTVHVHESRALTELKQCAATAI